MIDVPDECKFFKTCSVSVDKDHFEHICSTGNWVHCKVIRPEDIREYKKTPPEWEKELAKK